MSLKRDSTLADPQQIIADLERRLAARTAERDERTQERDEALQRETATAEVLGVINSSPGDLTPVFDAILEKALSLCDAVFGVLWTKNDEFYRVAALRGAPPAYAEFVTREPRGHEPGGALGRLARGEALVHVPDAASSPGDQMARTQADLSGARTVLAVPLRKDEVLLGAFVIYRQVVRPFTDKQIALLQSFAAQAVIAMENARLLTETRDALEQQTATAEVLGVINSSPGDLGPVFDAILEKALVLCEAKCGNITIYDGEAFNFVAAAGHAEFDEWVRQNGSARPGPGTTMERMIRGEQVVHIADIEDDEVYRAGSPVRKALVEIGGFHTFLGVALRKDDALLGILHIYRQEVRPFSDKQIALLQNFAAQAVIAMENARLITETREALDQQTATAEVLGVINASPGDLTPVFDAILEKARSLCEGTFGALFLAEADELFRAVAMRGGTAAWHERIRRGFAGSETPASAPLLAGERFVHIVDLAQIDHPMARAAVEAVGVRTFLSVPLRKDNTVVGMIFISRGEVRPFTDKQIALLQNFAAQAVIAMENARLITETREALEQQTATAEVLGVINASPGDLAPVFDAILEKAYSLCGVAIGALEMWDGVLVRAVATRALTDEFDQVVRKGFAPQPNDPFWALVNGDPYVHVHDLAKIDDPTARDAVSRVGVGTFLAVALRKDNVLLGRIVAVRREVQPFSEKQIALLQNFSAQAVIAMENARLLGELRQRTEEVAELNRGLEARVAEQVDELGRVGRLKRFLAPQLAELIVSQGDEKILESHRREIVVVFCDLRGYTAFTETAEPEEVLDFLREYHGALGPLVVQFEGTLDQFSGDGIMVFFNDPVPIPDPAERAVKMAVAMREEAAKLIAAWRQRGRELGFGAGIAQGYATLGQIGFADRSGYTAIGTVCNVAARLCAEAKDGQILIGQRVNAALAANIATEQIGALALKGLTQPVIAFNVPVSADRASAAASGNRRRAPKARARRPRMTGSPA